MIALLHSLFGLYVMTALMASALCMTWHNNVAAGLTLFFVFMALWILVLRVGELLQGLRQDLATMQKED